MKGDPRKLAYQALMRVNRDRAWPRPILDKLFGRPGNDTRALPDQAMTVSGMDKRDRALAAELVYGVLRWQRLLDYLIGAYCRRPLKKIEIPILMILRMGAYQLRFLDRIPAHAAVNEAVSQAKGLRGKGGGALVNAILRRIAENPLEPLPPDALADPTGHLAITQSFPEWFVDGLLKRFDFAETESLLGALNDRAPLTGRVNLLRNSREEFLESLADENVEAQATLWAPAGFRISNIDSVDRIPSFGQGLWAVQDEAAQLVSLLLEPVPEQLLLDACAAPGGKTTHLAELARDRAAVDALDLDPRKAELIGQQARRLGLASIRIHAADARKPLAFAPREGYHGVLLDAPCSGYGTLRRHPEAKWTASSQDARQCAAIQCDLLLNLSAHVRPGGLLVYSVCTFTEEEGPGLIDRFLATHRDFTIDNPVDSNPDLWQGLVDARGYINLWPHHHDTDGFFAVRMKRRAS